VEREQVGRVFEPENVGQLAEALIELDRDRTKLDVWRENCLVAAHRYDRSALAEDMLQSLVAVAQTRT
jgi:hypothetical protein